MRKGKFVPALIAPCGMNCGICISFFGYTLHGKKRKRPCSGCRFRKTQCAFLKQQCDTLATRRIEYCFECTGFPCENLTTLDTRYRDKYGMSMIENLRYIQTQGIEQFLKNEQERWTCATCGGVICVHNETCYTCSQSR